ncbi:hypothetical protein MIB92_06530 [Aestuariirhabdus sp. Z084]|uniref:hypothetical protein n=1 Tax=Aestuariirhabdus haliotis TaxID=2918751 RepID=UPI00201B4471|nr:hypothetical protein [Aestuariirhabdus haliotis]MCL6415299.1 hypothetical protein [Aestuariirhabdus haliotis]MCL6419559.1 hypothetical protein [Aestuariirhabdus haliotis]
MNEPESPTDEQFVRSLYHSLEAEEPSAKLDEKILNTARLDAKKRRSDTSLAKWHRWQWPTSVAATLVLGSLIYLYQMPASPPEFLLDDAPLDSSSSVPAKPGSASGIGLQQKVMPSDAISSQGDTSAVPRQQSNAAKRLDDTGPPQSIGFESREKSAQRAESVSEAAAMESDLSTRSAPESITAYPARQPALSLEEKPNRSAGKAAVETDLGDKEELELPSPQQWLDSIQHLLDSGETEEAQRMFSEFRVHYPDFPVGQALQEALE